MSIAGCGHQECEELALEILYDVLSHVHSGDFDSAQKLLAIKLIEGFAMGLKPIHTADEVKASMMNLLLKFAYIRDAMRLYLQEKECQLKTISQDSLLK